MCRDRLWTRKNLIYWAQYSASYKLILTQPLNKRNTVALPSTADATPSLAHAEYSPLIVWWVVAGWQKKKKRSALFSWLQREREVGRAERMGFLCDWHRSITLWGEANEAGYGLLKGLAEKRLLQGLGFPEAQQKEDTVHL